MKSGLIVKESKGFYANADALISVRPVLSKKKEWDVVMVFKGGYQVPLYLGKVSENLANSVANAIATEVWGEEAVEKPLVDLDGILVKVLTEKEGGDSSGEKEEGE